RSRGSEVLHPVADTVETGDVDGQRALRRTRAGENIRERAEGGLAAGVPADVAAHGRRAQYVVGGTERDEDRRPDRLQGLREPRLLRIREEIRGPEHHDVRGS